MGALPVAKPALAPSQLLRNRTSYDKGTGFSVLYHAQVVDIIRLSSGPVCTALLLVINAHAERGAGRGSKFPDAGWTPAFSLEDWAELCRCSVRDIQRQRDYLVARKIVEVKKSAAGFAFTLRYRDWAEIADYDDWFAKQLKKPQDESEDEPVPEDPSSPDVKPGTVRLLKAPVRVAKGKESKGVRVECGVKSIKVQNRAPVDLSFDLVVKGGLLWITTAPTLEASGQKAKGSATKQVNSGQHDTGVVSVRKNSSNPVRRTKGETGGQADKLCSIFDELLQKSGSRLLSPDTEALDQAVSAILDTPLDYVLHFLNVGGRASRPISGPKAVVKILAECRRNWLAGGAKPKPAGRTQQDLDAIVEKERAELKRKREEIAALKRSLR